MKLVSIYNLKDDKKLLKDLQEASKSKRVDIGLEVGGFGVVGSAEWWNAIEQGKIRKEVIKGKISKVYKTGHNDFPQFDFFSDGAITSWRQYGNRQYYKVGNVLRLTYVVQKFKKPLEGVGDHTRLVLKVEAQMINIIKEPFDGFEMA